MPVSVTGKFVEIKLKAADGGGTWTVDDKHTKDRFQKWMAGLRDMHYVNEHFAHTVHFECDTGIELPHPELKGSTGTASPGEASFIYLDVGAWVGSKDKPWGGANIGPKIKRDFGIVCGPLVLLCTFEYAQSVWQSDGASHRVQITANSCQEWKKQNKNVEPYKSVQALLDCLSRPVEGEINRDKHGSLGAAFVREMRVAKGAHPKYPKEPENWVIHVILGDMHLPVLDKQIDTYGSTPVQLLKERRNSERSTQEVVGPHRVPRLGRVNLPALEAIVGKLISSDKAGETKLLEGFVDIAHRAIDGRGATSVAEGVTDALDVGYGLLATGVGAIHAAAVSDSSGVDYGTMTLTEATDWYEYYCVGKDSKPADIFENAGTHFLQFMQRLGAYTEKKKENASLLDAKFLQLGDFLDFWVGFTCHFRPSNHPDQPVKPSDTGDLMIRHWAKNLLSNTDQGKLVAEAFELAEEKELNPVYLYGNHDNYLGAMTAIDYGSKATLAPRLGWYADAGIFMEHGHQWESSNADNAGKLPTAQVIGTKSPMGVFVTQAAFVRPNCVRAFEGTAAGVVAAKDGTYGQRLDQIVGATSRFIIEGGGFYCYVMGHTHEPCLTTVAISSPRPNPVSRFMDRQNRLSHSKVVITQRGKAHEKILYVPGGAQGASVDIEWREMMGDKAMEWVALEDPVLASPGLLSKAVKGLAVANEKGLRHGTHTFTNVPPGLYEARFYLTRQASQCFRSSSNWRQNRIAVLGISLQGDADNTVGRRYHWEKGKGIIDPIRLRWAFPEEHFKSHSPWFALYREGEANDVVQFGMEQKAYAGHPLMADIKPLLGRPAPHPYRRFKDLLRFPIDAVPIKADPNAQLPDLSRLNRSSRASDTAALLANIKASQLPESGAGVNVGLWELDDVFKQALAQEPLGKWQLRAFLDPDQKELLGAVEIEIVKAPPHGKSKKRA